VAQRQDPLFVGGTWVAPRTGRRISVVSVSTEEEIGTVAEAGVADADAAVAAARAAFEDPAGWASWLPAERAAALERLAAGLYRRGARIANLVSVQTGLPIAQSSRQEAELPAQLLCHYADMLRRSAFEQRRQRSAYRATLIRREPIGVVAAITPSRAPRHQVRGPVIAVIPYADDADALRIANDSRNGLAGSVWTSDPERGLEVARRVRTGTIGSTTTYPTRPRRPAGSRSAAWAVSSVRKPSRTTSSTSTSTPDVGTTGHQDCTTV
jgi:acyl-CoA reductase-like NAD-dependent aldehyde dehydrogenase